MANNVINKYIVFISDKLESKFSKDLSSNKDVHIPLVELFLDNNLRGFITEFCVINNISRNSTSYRLVSNLTSKDLINSLEKPEIVEALKLSVIIVDFKLDLSIRVRSDIHIIKNVCVWTTGRAAYNYPINFEGERTICEVFYYIRTFPSAENFYVFSYLLGSTDKMPDFMIGHKHDQSKSSQEIFSYYLKGEIFPLCPFCLNLFGLLKSVLLFIRFFTIKDSFVINVYNIVAIYCDHGLVFKYFLGESHSTEINPLRRCIHENGVLGKSSSHIASRADHNAFISKSKESCSFLGTCPRSVIIFHVSLRLVGRFF